MKKHFLYLCAMAVVFAAASIVISCDKETKAGITGVKLNKSSVSLTYMGEEVKLDATVEPADVANAGFKWSSSDQGVVTVSSSGLVKATGKGTAVIIVSTLEGDFTDVCNVVSEGRSLPITSVSFNKPKAEVSVGDSLLLEFIVEPEGAAIASVAEWAFVPAQVDADDEVNVDQITLSIAKEQVQGKKIISNLFAQVQKLGPVGKVTAVVKDYDGFSFNVEIPVEIVYPFSPPEFDMKQVTAITFKFGLTWEPSSGIMGNEFNAHWVKLTKDYQIGTYEVTQRQWLWVMGENPGYGRLEHGTQPTSNSSPGVLQYFDWDLPISNVSFAQVEDFISKLNAKTGRNYRLPTEAEWQLACMGGHPEHISFYGGPPYPEKYRNTTLASDGYYGWNGGLWTDYSNMDLKAAGEGAPFENIREELPVFGMKGTEDETQQRRWVAWCGNGGGLRESSAKGRNMPVGQKVPNELGIYDMLGNVDEFVSDWFKPRSDESFAKYPEDDPLVDPKVTERDGTFGHVVKGGNRNQVGALRSSGREHGGEDDGPNEMRGFRLAHD